MTLVIQTVLILHHVHLMQLNGSSLLEVGCGKSVLFLSRNVLIYFRLLVALMTLSRQDRTFYDNPVSIQHFAQDGQLPECIQLTEYRKVIFPYNMVLHQMAIQLVNTLND